MNFGLLITEFDNLYTLSIVDSVSVFCKENDIGLLILMLGKPSIELGWEHGKDPFFESVFSNSLDGIIVIGRAIAESDSVEVYLKHRRKYPEIPVVYIDEQIEKQNSFLVSSCIKIGFEDLLDHLILEHNYKEFAFLTGSSNIKSAKEKNEIFFNKLKSYGINTDSNLIIDSGNHYNSGSSAIKYLIKNKYIEKIDVLVTINDDMALNAWHELENNGYAVPEDIAVTGMGNFHIDKYYENHLTTIETNIPEKGRKAAETLVKVIQGKAVRKNIRIDTKAVFRDSCGCIHTPEFNIASAQDLDAVFSVLPESTIQILWENIEKLKTVIKNAVYEDVKEDIRKKWFSLIAKAVYLEVPRTVIFSILDYVRFVLAEWDQMAEEHVKILMNGAFFIDETFARFLSMQKNVYMNKDRNMDMLGYNAVSLAGTYKLYSVLKDFFKFSELEFVYLGNYEEKKKEIKTDFFLQSNKRINSKISYSINEVLNMTEKYLSPDNPLIAMPLNYSDRFLGLAVFNFSPDKIEIYDKLRLRFSVLGNVSYNISNLKKEINARSKAEKKLEQLSYIDELTGLHNRRGFYMFAEQQLKQLKREGRPFAIIYADMDNMKYINDKWLHEAGDKALIEAAKALKETVRETDIVARVGGDEFILFVALDAENQGKVFLNRLKESLTKKDKELKNNGCPWDLSMSLGIKVSDRRTYSLDSMISAADKLLYKEKLEKKKSAAAL